MLGGSIYFYHKITTFSLLTNLNIYEINNNIFLVFELFLKPKKERTMNIGRLSLVACEVSDKNSNGRLSTTSETMVFGIVVDIFFVKTKPVFVIHVIWPYDSGDPIIKRTEKELRFLAQIPDEDLLDEDLIKENRPTIMLTYLEPIMAGLFKQLDKIDILEKTVANLTKEVLILQSGLALRRKKKRPSVH